MRNLGGAGDKDTETEVLLLEHDVPHQPFSQAVLSFLPKMPWSITEEVKLNLAVSVLPMNNKSVPRMSALIFWSIVLCIHALLLTEHVAFLSGSESQSGPEAAVCVQCRSPWLHRH